METVSAERSPLHEPALGSPQHLLCQSVCQHALSLTFAGANKTKSNIACLTTHSPPHVKPPIYHSQG